MIIFYFGLMLIFLIGSPIKNQQILRNAVTTNCFSFFADTGGRMD